MAALEGGIGAIAVASGQAALHLAIATLMGAGSHIVASTALYGGSQNLLHYTLRRFGIDTTFVRPGDIDGWRAAVRPETRLFFGETVGNPGLDVLDIPTVAQIAHEAGVPLLVDSTLTTPWLIKPLEHGADLVYHSATKFLSGHGTVIGGVVVDGGSFDWDRSGKFPEPDRALRRVSRHDLQRGKHRRRLPAARAPRGPARLWRLHEPAHRLADPAGHRDSAAAHGAAHGQHRKKVVQFLAAHPLVGRVGHPLLEATPATRWPSACCPWGAWCGLGVQLRHQGFTRPGQGLHRGAEGVQPPGQRGRLPLAGDPPGQHHPLPHETTTRWPAPASAPAPSACRSAWKTPTT
jgi:O-acetylhomoserine (thiol)-lyase